MIPSVNQFERSYETLILYDDDLDLKGELGGLSQYVSCPSSRNGIIVQPLNIPSLNNNIKYNMCCVSGFTMNILHPLACLILTTNLGGKYFYYSHFTNEKLRHIEVK